MTNADYPPETRNRDRPVRIGCLWWLAQGGLIFGLLLLAAAISCYLHPPTRGFNLAELIFVIGAYLTLACQRLLWKLQCEETAVWTIEQLCMIIESTKAGSAGATKEPV